jgi:O-antigen ligase
LVLVALVVWEAALQISELRKLVIAWAIPAAVLAFLAILQHHGIYQPFPLEVDANSRLALTSLAGGPFDLATFLVVPILIAQGALARRDLGTARWWWLALLGMCLYAVALTQTLSALAAIGVGSVLLWMQLVDRRRLVVLAVAGAVVAGALLAGAPPLRQRVSAKIEQVRGGSLNDALTGRLDGWRTAWWMIEQHPVVGVGHGAFRAEFAAARLALVAQGVRFYRSQQQPFFENPHSDLLAVAASWGALGVAAQAAALIWVGRGSLRAGRGWRAAGPAGRVDAAVASAALGATLLETTATFPLHLAMVMYPMLVLIAAMFRGGRESVAMGGARETA